MMKLLSTEEKYAVGVLISFVAEDWNDDSLKTLLNKLITQLLLGNELEGRLLSKEFTGSIVCCIFF